MLALSAKPKHHFLSLSRVLRPKPEVGAVLLGPEDASPAQPLKEETGGRYYSLSVTRS